MKQLNKKKKQILIYWIFLKIKINKKNLLKKERKGGIPANVKKIKINTE